MKTSMTIVVLGLVLVLLCPAWGSVPQTQVSVPEKPGEIERAALGKADFLVGDWEGEGWSLKQSGERTKFWAKEFFRYRGDRDLMDMEGRFGDILPDGARTAELEYALGILFYDRRSGEYRMWHYSNDGNAFEVKMEIDATAKTAWYTRTNAEGRTYKFSLGIGIDGVWVSRIDLLRPDKSWLQVMEFRMKRVR